MNINQNDNYYSFMIYPDISFYEYGLYGNIIEHAWGWDYIHRMEVK